jgi:hypothetical protein
MTPPAENESPEQAVQDQEEQELSGALAGRLFEAGLGAFELATVSLGSRLGLYQALADSGPCTAAQLAASAGIDPRYAREWCEQQAVAELLTVYSVDDRTRRAALQHATRKYGCAARPGEPGIPDPARRITGGSRSRVAVGGDGVSYRPGHSLRGLPGPARAGRLQPARVSPANSSRNGCRSSPTCTPHWASGARSPSSAAEKVGQRSPLRSATRTTLQASLHAADRSVATPKGHLTLGFDPDRFQPEPPVCYRTS